MEMDVYIKPKQKTKIFYRRIIYLKDIAEIYAERDVLQNLNMIPVFQIPKETGDSYLLSSLDLVREILRRYPNASISNLGEDDILIEYHPKKIQENGIWKWMKILFVSVILFCGASTTIMCFHSDAQLPLIFQNFYYMFYGENKELPLLLAVPYSIGLGVGILVFFNHFSKFVMSKDPTPIEVEMTTYEKETIQSTIEQLNRKKERRDGA